MAHKKAAGSASNLRDSKPKYRGVKVFGWQTVKAGNIIIRQKGSKYLCGENTYMGKDFSVHAKIDGVVVFAKKKVTKFNGRKYIKTIVDVTTEIQKSVEKKLPVKKATSASSDKKVTKVKKTIEKKDTVKKTTAKKVVVKKVAEEKVPAKKK